MNDNHSGNFILIKEEKREETETCDKCTTFQEGKDLTIPKNHHISNDKASITKTDVPALPLQSHDSEYHLTSEHPIETDSTKSPDDVYITNSTNDTKVEAVPTGVAIPSTSDSQPDLLYHTPRSSKLSSTDSEESIKTFNANNLRKKRPKSDTIISKIIVDRSKKNGFIRSKHSSPSGRAKDKANSQTNCNSWRILDICDRIVLKGCRSLAKLYTGIPTEPPSYQLERYNQKIQDTQEIRNVLVELLKVQSKQAEENQQLRDDVRKVMSKLDRLEDKLRAGQTSYSGHRPPPPPPPPPPPSLPGDFHTRHRIRSAPIKKSSPCLPRFTITPQDIANVKLKRTKTKSASK